MAVKNRTVLEECKLLAMMKRWVEKSEAQLKELRDLNESSDEPRKWIEEIIVNLIDKVVDGEDKLVDNKIIGDLLETLNLKSKTLYEEWNNLKQAFKIPKKQRIEDRKEHERELNSTMAHANSSYNSIKSEELFTHRDFYKPNFYTVNKFNNKEIYNK